jgi:predicted ATPase/class 3 adenylate cyclase
MNDDLYACLTHFGLEAYAELLEDNDVDLDILAELTEEDLEKLGLPMGHRKRMLKLIRSRRADADARAGTSPAEAELAVPVAHALERRQVTVMICDMVGSTALSQRFDPEDLGCILSAYQDCCQQVITQYGGTISRYTGDGIFAYFGYPQADEIDAERAIRAALELVRKVEGLAPCDIQLQTRVGIASGLVVIGQAPQQFDTVFGEIPNLAARLEALAAAGTVVISDGTRRLATHQFELRDLGRHHLKGFIEPVQAWQVMGESHVSSRSEALVATTDLTPLVDREEEVELLRRRWQRARKGNGQIVLIVGDAGIGKSRLVQTLIREPTSEPHQVLRFYCSPHYQSSALHPVTEQLYRAAAFAPGDTSDEKLNKLEALLAPTADDLAAVAPLFAELLSIAPGDRYPPLNLSPQGRKQKTLDALEEQLARSARRQPVLVIFEDLHWSDPTTRDLLNRIVDRIPTLPVLMLLTFRPEFATPWSDRHYVTTLFLRQLSPEASIDFLDHLTSEKSLPKEIISQIIARTDGNPLFMEELYKGVVEGGILRDEGDHYALKAPIASLSVPSTLADSLMARLDRANPVKEVAQVASALGRQFSSELLAGVTSLGHQELFRALSQLVKAKIIYQRGSEPGATYVFKHAMLQEAAYSSLLHSKRQLLHARIAQELEQKYPEKIEIEPELIAHHYTGAGEAQQAISYWHKAGQRAVQRSANAEAVDHLNRGLELLDALPSKSELAQKKLALLTSLGPALSATRGFASKEVEATYSSARALCQQLGDASTDFSVLRGLWVYYFIRGDLHAAHDLGSQLFKLAELEDRSGYFVEAHRVLGQTLLYEGDFGAARAHLEQGLALYDPNQHRAHIYLYGNDSAVVCSSYLAYALWFLGHQDQAFETCRKTLRDARELAHPFSLALALAFAAYLHQHAGDAVATGHLADETITISTEQGFPFWAKQEAILAGWALAEQGQIEEGRKRLQQGLDDYRGMGSGLACPWFLGLLAQVHAKGGQLNAGLEVLEEALTTSKRTGERFYLAELYRLRGELTLAKEGLNAASEVERDYRQALDTARQQGAASWELRTTVSEARLWRDLGNLETGRESLLAVCARFEQGFDSTDLTQARALLDEVNELSPSHSRI